MANPLGKAPVFANIGDWVWKNWFNDLSSIITPTGMMIPRLSPADRNALVNPHKGQLIYNTTTNKLNVYTTAWEQVTSV